jgi:hypothetical protein
MSNPIYLHKSWQLSAKTAFEKRAKLFGSYILGSGPTFVLFILENVYNKTYVAVWGKLRLVMVNSTIQDDDIVPLDNVTGGTGAVKVYRTQPIPGS